MVDRRHDHTLEFLLDFDGHVHRLAGGYWIKFEIKRVEATKRRPHGLVYSFTLHAPNGVRLIGFDNAHVVPATGSRFKRRPEPADHWHRTEDDRGRPYEFKDADTLLADFFRSPQGYERARHTANRRSRGDGQDVRHEAAQDSQLGLA